MAETDTVKEFLQTLESAAGDEPSILVHAMPEPSLPWPKTTISTQAMEWQRSEEPSLGHGLICLDLGLGRKPSKVVIGNAAVTAPQELAQIVAAAPSLAEGGLLVSVVLPMAFGQKPGQSVLKNLEEQGVHLAGVFETPPNTLRDTSIRPLLAVFRRGEALQLFVGSIGDASQASELANNFLRGDPGGQLSTGRHIQPDSFVSFGRLRAERRLADLATEYSDYDVVTVADVAREINVARSGEEYSPSENAVYLPLLGTSAATADLTKVTVKHHNVAQIVLEDRAMAEYVAAYFESDAGRLVRESATGGNVIPKITKSNIGPMSLPLPGLREQQDIVDSHRSLEALQESLAQFKREIAVNPKSAVSIRTQVHAMLEQIGNLSREDQIRNLVMNGESAKVEFKETFCWDVRQEEKAKHIETSALKTIVGFLNSDGGTLLVGVSDAGTITGLEPDVKCLGGNVDKFLLHVKNNIKQRIGEPFYPFIDYDVVKVGDEKILQFTCGPSKKACYLDERDFYVRTNPATDKLEGPKLLEYVKHRFG